MRQTRKQAFNASELIPIMCEEVLPGDTWQHKENIVARLATPIAPILDDLDLETFYFFVPNRILWDGWEFHHRNRHHIHDARHRPRHSGTRQRSTTEQRLRSLRTAAGHLHRPRIRSLELTHPRILQNLERMVPRPKPAGRMGLQRYLQQRLQLPDHPRRHTMGSNAAPHQQTPRLLHKLTSVAAKRDGRQPAHYGQRTSHTNHHGRQSRKTILHQRSHRQYQPIPNDRHWRRQRTIQRCRTHRHRSHGLGHHRPRSRHGRRYRNHHQQHSSGLPDAKTPRTRCTRRLALCRTNPFALWSTDT